MSDPSSPRPAFSEVEITGGLRTDCTGRGLRVVYSPVEGEDSETVHGTVIGMIPSSTELGPPYRGVRLDSEDVDTEVVILTSIGSVSRERESHGYKMIGEIVDAEFTDRENDS